MDKNYLIIFDREGNICHGFYETEEQLFIAIDWCNRNNHEIIFAAKIAIIKEFVG